MHSVFTGWMMTAERLRMFLLCGPAQQQLYCPILKICLYFMLQQVIKLATLDHTCQHTRRYIYFFWSSYAFFHTLFSKRDCTSYIGFKKSACTSYCIINSPTYHISHFFYNGLVVTAVQLQTKLKRIFALPSYFTFYENIAWRKSCTFRRCIEMHYFTEIN